MSSVDPIFWLVLFIAAVVIYTGAKVRKLMRQSEEQWRSVDHSKLRNWDEEED